jgi:hypothetical protein
VKITSQLRSDSDFALLTTVMNLFVLTEITPKSRSQQYTCTAESASKSVRSLIQLNLSVNWFERSLSFEMPIVHLNYALRQLGACRANTSCWIRVF